MVTQPQSARSHVVVGYDGSPGAIAAVEWATDQANDRGLPLQVRSVVEPPGILAEDVLGDGWAEDSQTVADQLAREGADVAARTATVPVVTCGVVGHPSAGLVDGSEDAALLVVGAHGEDGPPTFLVGFVAFSVTVHARCPVAVVRGAPPRRPGPGTPVVVGVDGSRSATAALLEAAGLAARSGAELVVVSAWRTASSTRLGSRWDDTWRRQSASHPAHVAAEAVARAEADRARHVHPGLTVSSQVLQGAPARVLADLSASAGTVVIGSRGRGGFTGLLLGSVTRRLVHEASCPVIVVRRVPERPSAADPAEAGGAPDADG
jgi:nucleotide-binding universal stress UspA family protein